MIFLFSFAELKLPAICTVEVIRVIRIIFEYERLFVNNGMTLLANVLSQASSFFPVMARTAEMSETAQKREISKVSTGTTYCSAKYKQNIY